MRPRPVILVLIKGLGWGGAERLIVDAATHWDTETFDYRVAYVLPWKDAFVPELRATGVEVVCIGGRRGFSLPSTIRRLRRLIASASVDLVHAHLPSTGILARIASSAPVIYTEHNVASSYRPITRLLNRMTYGMNDAVTAVSAEVAASLASYPGTPEIVPNGVSTHADLDAAIRVRKELDLSEDAPLVVHVGNIRPHKGHRTLIEAADKLRELYPEAVVVSIGVEKVLGHLDQLRLEASSRKLSNLVFLGPRQDARDFISAADVLVNPSDVEGLPITILEAMAVGTPVVATSVGGVPEVISHQRTGLLVSPGDPDALAEQIAVLLGNPRQRDELSASAADLVAERYGIEHMVRTFEDLYKAVLNEQHHN